MKRVGRWLVAASAAVLAMPLAAAVPSAPAAAADALPPGWIETVAGTRVEGALGTDLDFAALGLDNLTFNDEAHLPVVAVDDTGRAVFTVNDQIFRVEADGRVRRLAGLGVPGTFTSPQNARDVAISNVRRLAVDSSGNVLVTEALGLRFRFLRIRPDGTAEVRGQVLRSACERVPLEAGVIDPACRTWDAFMGADGSIYFLYYRTATSTGTKLGVVRPGGAPQALAPSLSMPLPQGPDVVGVGVAPGPGGDVDVLFGSPDQLVHVTANGATTVRTDATKPYWFGRRDLVRDAAGNLYSGFISLQTWTLGGGPVRRLAPNSMTPVDVMTFGTGVAWNVSATGRYGVYIGGGVMVVSDVTTATGRVVAGGGTFTPAIALQGGLSRSPTDDPATLPAIALMPDGSLLVPGRIKAQLALVTRVDPTGSLAGTYYGTNLLRLATAVAVAPNGDVFAALLNQGNGESILVTTPPGSGRSGGTADLGGLLPPGAWDVAALAAGPDDVAYAAVGNAIYRLRRSALGAWFAEPFAGGWTPCASTADPCAGVEGSYADSVALFAPRGLAVGPDGSLYVAEAAVPLPGQASTGGRVRRITPDGRIRTVVGTGRYGTAGDGGPATQAELGGPGGIAFGPDGSLYIADFYASRVRRVLPSGTIVTVAGNSTYTADTERGPALGPVFVGPASVAVAADGTLYVNDAGTTSVRRIAPGSTDVLATSTQRRASFVAAAPTRVMDTRQGLGATGPVAPGGTVLLDVGAPVPPDAIGVAFNVTLTESAGGGYVTVYPAEEALPLASSLNVDGPGQTVPNLVVVPLGSSRRTAFFAHAGGHLVADVVGWFVPAEGAVAAGRYRALPPTRALDTRAGARPGAGASVVLPLRGAAGVPAQGVAAVALNVTITESAAPGYVQVIPTGGTTPVGASSNLNTTHAGQTIANLVLAPVGDDGSVTIFTQSGTHVVVDVLGYYTDATADASTSGLFVPVVPARLVDTRTSGAKPAAGGSIDVDPLAVLGVAPGTAAAVVATVTVTEASAGGYVQALPRNRAAIGSSSTVNVERTGQTIANASQLTLGDGDAITVYTQSGAHLVVDTQGYYLT